MQDEGKMGVGGQWVQLEGRAHENIYYIGKITALLERDKLALGSCWSS